MKNIEQPVQISAFSRNTENSAQNTIETNKYSKLKHHEKEYDIIYDIYEIPYDKTNEM